MINIASKGVKDVVYLFWYDQDTLKCIKANRLSGLGHAKAHLRLGQEYVAYMPYVPLAKDGSTRPLWYNSVNGDTSGRRWTIQPEDVPKEYLMYLFLIEGG